MSNEIVFGVETSEQSIIGFIDTSKVIYAESGSVIEEKGHITTIAPTGAGKGISCVIPTLLTYSGSIIVVDPKGENYEVTHRRRRQLNQGVVILDPFKKTSAAVY